MVYLFKEYIFFYIYLINLYLIFHQISFHEDVLSEGMILLILLIVYINIIIFSAFQRRQIFYFIYFDSTFFYHLIWNAFMCGYFSNQSVAVAERKKSYLDKKWRILLFHRQKQALSGNNVFFLFFKNVYEVSWECQWIFDDIINSVYMVILI